MSQSVIILGPQIVCTECGVTFAMADTVCESYRDNNTTFYCTNGHPLSYQADNKKRVSSLEKENKSLKDQIESLTKENTLLKEKLAKVEVQVLELQDKDSNAPRLEFKVMPLLTKGDR